MCQILFELLLKFLRLLAVCLSGVLFAPFSFAVLESEYKNSIFSSEETVSLMCHTFLALCSPCSSSSSPCCPPAAGRRSRRQVCRSPGASTYRKYGAKIPSEGRL